MKAAEHCSQALCVSMFTLISPQWRVNFSALWWPAERQQLGRIYAVLMIRLDVFLWMGWMARSEHICFNGDGGGRLEALVWSSLDLSDLHKRTR